MKIKEWVAEQFKEEKLTREDAIACLVAAGVPADDAVSTIACQEMMKRLSEEK